MQQLSKKEHAIARKSGNQAKKDTWYVVPKLQLELQQVSVFRNG